METRLINSDQLSYNSYPGMRQRIERNNEYRVQREAMMERYKNLQIDIPLAIKDLPRNYPTTPAAECAWNCDTPRSEESIKEAEALHQETLAAIQNGENSYNNDQPRLEEAALKAEKARPIQEVRDFSASAENAAKQAACEAAQAAHDKTSAVDCAKKARHEHSWAGRFSVFKQKAKENVRKIDVIKGVNKLLCSF